MIEIKGLKKTFPGGTQAVRGVDLKVEAGELLALLGPNGAGKTTTIRACTTLSGFDDGTIRVAGHDVDREPGTVRRSIGYVAQSTGVDFFLTGRENLVLQGRLYHLPGREITARVEELARQFDLADALDRPVSTYSGGMQRKLDIATALIHRPQVLFLDEPTLGLDTASRRALWRLIHRLNREEALTILLTTHYLEEADDLAHRVAIMHQGEVKVVDEPERLKAQLGGDSLTIEFPPGISAQDWLETLAPRLRIQRQIWEGDKLHLYLPDASHAIPLIMESARAQGLEVRGISLSRPTLDDVFLHYTGASLQGGVEEAAEPWWKKWAGKGGGGAWGKQWQQREDEEAGDEADWHRWQTGSGEEAAGDGGSGWRAGQGATPTGSGREPPAEEVDGQDGGRAWGRQTSPTAENAPAEGSRKWPEESGEWPKEAKDWPASGENHPWRGKWQKKGEDEA